MADSVPQRPPLRAVFLDVGETLMHPDPTWEHVYERAFADFGIEVEMPALQTSLRRAYRGGGYGFDGSLVPSADASHRRLVEMDRNAFDEVGIGPLPEEFFLHLADLFMDPATWHVFPDVWVVLPQLKERGLVLGAVSNWAWQLPELLDALELGQYLDFVAASARIGYDKPHPGIFRWALDQAGVAPEAVMHVGDHVDADVAGARGVGIEPILLDRRARYQPPPDIVAVIRTLDELLPMVDARLPAAPRASG